MKKFFGVIGNPPYQDEALGENAAYAPQIYPQFIDASYEVGETVELVHPGRFLFNAGSTPKAWNKKMLEDPHLKLVHYEPNARKLFPSAQITGGIAITYHDSRKDYEPIGIFTPFPELNSVRKKACRGGFSSLSTIVFSAYSYHLTELLYSENPQLSGRMSKGHEFDLKSNVFESLSPVFYEECPNDGLEYIRILGRQSSGRTYRFIRRDYVRPVDNLDKYKIVLARADGAAGTIGNPVPARILGASIIEEPGTGLSETFLSVGSFDTRDVAENALKYIRSKFSRALVSVLKTTQDINPGKWEYVPLQDFTDASDIDWSKSIHEIDQQLYTKYGLDADEIEFIETHVKEMS